MPYTVIERPSPPRTVVVHNGSRGPKGLSGPAGAQGAPGSSVRVLGGWVSGTEYAPLDAVSWRGSLVEGINSLYIQRSDQPASVSTTPPHLDLGRWEEIGAVDWDNSFGGIWYVQQVAHGFTRVGQPVGYSFQSDSYVLADARLLDEVAIAVVREIIDENQFVLQSSGEVPGIDPAVIWPDGSSWASGRVYYVSTRRGRLELSAPSNPSHYINPVLIPTDILTGSTRNGVALPWTPALGASATNYVPVGWNKFYYTMTAGQTDITGLDLYGNTLAYEISDLTDVFHNGLNLLSTTQFTAADGATITLTTPAQAGDTIEIWTPDQPRELLVPSTVVKIDGVESMFNGVETDFAIQVLGTPVLTLNATNVMVWLDGHAQEALVDYFIVENPGSPGSGEGWIQFAEPPVIGTSFWGVVFMASGA